MKKRMLNGQSVSIHNLEKDIIRLRISEDVEKESLLERYGIINTDLRIEDAVDDVNKEVSEKENEKEINISFPSCKVMVDLENGNIRINDKVQMECFNGVDHMKTAVSFSIKEEERFYGLGFRSVDFLELRGHSVRVHVSYGEAYGPVPFIMSSNGWGLYFNTTCDSYFDVGVNDKNKLLVWSENGELDFYFFMAEEFKKQLELYTRVTGRPTLMPRWAYGLMFITNEKETQFDVLHDVEKFMSEGLACDSIGLEPSWMQNHYDASTKKDWNKDRFYMPWWSEDRKSFRDVTFVGALSRYNFNVSLWLCCDYNIFIEEERQVAEKEKSKDGEGLFKKLIASGKFDFDTRVHSPIYMDKLTEPEEPWFEHLKKFIDIGVKAFKQDPAFVVNDHPDRYYGNGMTDAEVHNMFSPILAKQVHKAYKEYTGKRPMYYTGTAYTGIQGFAPSWTCDCGGRETALTGIIQYGLMGHMNVTCDMDAYSKEAIHFGFLLPWSQINSWAYIEHPWWIGEELYRIFKDYLNLHYSLLPYLYSCAHIGHETGMPIVRAMPLMFQNDRNCDNLMHQYMLGDNLLAGAFTDKLYLPDGEWYDYFTEKKYKGNQSLTYTPPENRGGALFVKAGAIIPMWRGAKNAARNPELIEVHAYPGPDSSFILYEDDGESFEFETGAVAKTLINQKTVDGKCVVEISDTIGEYQGMPGKREYEIIVHQ